MMYKSEKELREVITLGKPEEVIDIFLESYLQGLEFDNWKEDKDLEAVEEIVVGQDDEGNDIFETRLVNTYEPIDVSEQMTQWKIDNYILLREPLYPKLEIFADAWVKQDNEAMEDYRQKCLNVKELYPKVKHGTETI